MAKTKRQRYVYSLAAGEEKLIHFTGDFIRLISWSGDVETLEVGFGDGEALAIMDVGDEWRGDIYPAFRIKNGGSTTGTVKILVGNGQSANYAFTSSSTLTVNPSGNGLTSGVLAPTTTAASMIAASSSRREVMLQNNGSYAVWIGGTDVDAATKKGIKLEVGATMVLSTSAAIWMDGDGGTGSISYNVITGA